MRMTSLVVSMLLTASVLAWTSRNKTTKEIVHTCRTRRRRHLVAIAQGDVRGRGASYVGAVANVLGENLQGDSLGVVRLFSLNDSTTRLKTEEKDRSRSPWKYEEPCFTADIHGCAQ